MDVIRRVLRTITAFAILGILIYLARQALIDMRVERVANKARESYKAVVSKGLDGPADPASLRNAENAAVDNEGGGYADLIQTLREQYGSDDIVGYIRIEGTSADYIVTQHSDNEFYLTRDIYKEDSVAGWVFMDSKNNAEGKVQNIVIYAHNMRNRVMFHDLRLFKDEEFFRSNRRIEFNTAQGQGEWEIFSSYETGAGDPYNQTGFASSDEFMALAGRMREMSWYDADIEISPEDRILTLSTCDSGGRDGVRLVVHAALVTAFP
jgi:sortase B